MSSLEWLVIGSVYAAKLVRVTRVGSSGLPTRVNFGNGYLLYVVAMSDLTLTFRSCLLRLDLI